MAAGLTSVLVDGERPDVVPLEEPLSVVIDEVPFVVLMRTPTGADDDRALVAGFLAAEGVIVDADDVASLAPCETDANLVRVRLASGVRAPEPRPVAMTSACGVCGTRTIEQVLRRLPRRAHGVPEEASVVRALAGLAERARPHQALFLATGSVHAAALFAGPDLGEVALREDVGRHNATDKVLGAALLAGQWPLAGATLWVSGRVAFEIVQKALIAGVGRVVGVGGPTSLAVDLARSASLPLYAFVRADHANRYA